MCFEKPRKKWLLGEHVASQRKTHGGRTVLHVGPVAVQRILCIPLTIVVQVPTLTGTDIGLAQPGVRVILLTHGRGCPAPSGWRRGALRSGPRGPISEAVALLFLICRRVSFLLNKKGLPPGRLLRWCRKLGVEVARSLIDITGRGLA